MRERWNFMQNPCVSSQYLMSHRLHNVKGLPGCNGKVNNIETGVQGYEYNSDSSSYRNLGCTGLSLYCCAMTYQYCVKGHVALKFQLT